MKNIIQAKRNGGKTSKTPQGKTEVSKFQQRCIEAAARNRPEIWVPGAGLFTLPQKCREAIEAQAKKKGVSVDTFVKTSVRPTNFQASLAELVIPNEETQGFCLASCLAVYDRENGEVAYKIPLSEGEFISLRNRALLKKRGHG